MKTKGRTLKEPLSRLWDCGRWWFAFWTWSPEREYRKSVLAIGWIWRTEYATNVIHPCRRFVLMVLGKWWMGDPRREGRCR